MATVTLPGVLLSGTNAGRPAAGDVAVGTLYAETDTGQTFQSDGSTWNAWGASAFLSPLTTLGDLLVGDGASGDRLGVGTDGDVLVADSGEPLGVKWDTAGGGGGLMHSTLGKTAVGGSSFSFAALGQCISKKITLATDGLLASINAHLGQTSNGVIGFMPLLFTDNAGDPELIRGYTGGGDVSYNLALTATGSGVARWIGFPMGIWLPAGDYWIGVQLQAASSGTGQIEYDASSNLDWAHTSSGSWGVDAVGGFAGALVARDHSIYADILS